MNPLTVQQLIDILDKVKDKDTTTVWTSRDAPVVGSLGIDDNNALILEV